MYVYSFCTNGFYNISILFNLYHNTTTYFVNYLFILTCTDVRNDVNKSVYNTGPRALIQTPKCRKFSVEHISIH